MKTNKLWLGILAIALIFSMTIVGCGDDKDAFTHYDYHAYLRITNTSSIDYNYTSSKTRETTDGVRLDSPYTLKPNSRVDYSIIWNEGESGNITIYYTSESSYKNPATRSYYYFTDGETREINIP